MSLRAMGAADAVKPNVPRARASATSLAATVLESTTATSVSTTCAEATDMAAAARSHPASAATRRIGIGPRRAARGSERLANREIDLDPVVLLDLADRIAHVEADRADRRGEPEAAADAGVEVVEGEILDLGRDGTGVEEGNAAEPAVDRKAPLEVEYELEVAAQRVAGGIQRSDLVQLVAAHGRAATGLEPILDHEGVRDAVGRGQPQTAREREDRRRRPRDEEGILETKLHEVDVAAERGGADLEGGVVIASSPGIGRQVAKLEGQRGHDAGDEVVALLDGPRLHELGIDVVTAVLLEAIPKARAQALGMVRGLLRAEQLAQQIALHGEGHAQSIADVADLLRALPESDRFGLPFRSEDPGLAVLQLGSVALLAHPLAERDAAAGPEQVVLTDRHEPAKALVRIVSTAELEAPRLGLTQCDRHVPIRRLWVALRLDVDAIEEARGVEAAPGLGQVDRGERVAVLERQLAHDDVELRGGETGDQDLADPRDLAFLHRVRRLEARRRLRAGQAHGRSPEAAALVELLDLAARLLGPCSVPGIAVAKPDRLADQIQRDELGARDDDPHDSRSRPLDDGNEDPGVRPVVAEARARRPDLRRGETLSAQILPDHLHVAGELLLDVETAEDAERDQAGRARLHLVAQFVRGHQGQPFKVDALDCHARPLLDVETHVMGHRVAAERARHLGEVIAGLAIGLRELLGARPDLDVVEHRGLAEGQLLTKLGFLERVTSHELDDRLRALQDLQGDVDAVERGVERRLAGCHSGLEEALLAQLLVEGAQPLAIGALAEHVALAEPQGLAQGLLLCPREPVDLHLAHVSLEPGRDHEGDQATVGLGILARIDPDVGAQVTLAAQARHHVGARALETLGLGRAADRQRRRGGQVGGREAEVAGPVHPLDAGAPRDVIAEPDAIALGHHLDLDAIEDSEPPEAIEALAHPRAREGQADQVRESLLRLRADRAMGRDHLDRYHRRRRGRVRRDGRGHEDRHSCRERRQQAADHRKRKRRMTSPPKPPLNACSPAISSGPKT